MYILFQGSLHHRDILTSTLHLSWTVTVSRSRHKVCCPAVHNSAAFGGLQPTAAPAHCPCLRLPPCPVQAGVIPLTRPLNRGIFLCFGYGQILVMDKFGKNMQKSTNGKKYIKIHNSFRLIVFYTKPLNTLMVLDHTKVK